MKKNIWELLDSSYQGVERLFVLAYISTTGNNQLSIDSCKKYFFPRVKIENYNIEFDGKTFMINQLMTQLSNILILKRIIN